MISERRVWVRLLWRHLLVISISDQGIPGLAERRLITTITHMNYCQRKDGILATHSKEGTPRLLLRWLVNARALILMRGFFTARGYNSWCDSYVPAEGATVLEEKSPGCSARCRLQHQHRSSYSVSVLLSAASHCRLPLFLPVRGREDARLCFVSAIPACDRQS